MRQMPRCPVRRGQGGMGKVQSAEKISQMQPYGRLACKQCGADRRAQIRSGIGIGETHALGRQSVNVRCFVEGATVTTEIPPTEIIGEDQQRKKKREKNGTGTCQPLLNAS